MDVNKTQAASPRGRSRLTVERSSVEGLQRNLLLSNGEHVRVHRFACIGKGDAVRLSGGGVQQELSVQCRNGDARVLPAYQTTLNLPGISSPVYIKEIDQQQELDAYERLASYHYRNQASFGRKAILIAKIGSHKHAKIVGYVELTNTFSGHEARNKLLDAPYSEQHAAWDRWNVEAKKKYLNAIARISRCVVHPEYRGLGLGKGLCSSAIDYSKRSWHIAGFKPLFLEITADMLKFVPFVEKSGMSFIGTTTGNLKRLLKDQTYLKAVKEDIASGVREANSHAVFSDSAKSILQRQRRDVGELELLSAEKGVDVLGVLRMYASAASADQIPAATYALLHRFLRFPKPTYMIGLNAASDAFVRRRLTDLQVQPLGETPDLKVRPLPSPIKIEELTISHDIAIPASDWSNALQEAFGIHQQAIAQTGVRAVSLEIHPRDVVYVWGASGSGKTVFLDAIQGKVSPTGGKIAIPRDAKIGSLTLEFQDQPVVLEAGGTDLKESLFALGMVGLSEANLYFKSPQHLSNGQRYRLALAKLILSRSQIWVIDEFCSVLDDGTAELIAWNVGKFARMLGVTAVIAGPRRAPVLKPLAPDRMLLLDSLGDWRVEEKPH